MKRMKIPGTVIRNGRLTNGKEYRRYRVSRFTGMSVGGMDVPGYFKHWIRSSIKSNRGHEADETYPTPTRSDTERETHGQ